MRINILERLMSVRQMSMKNWVWLLSLSFVAGLGVSAQAVDQSYTAYGNGVQIWFQAEDFSERIPDTDEFYALAEAPDGEIAFGDDVLNTINRLGGPGGRISYDFDISPFPAGTWYMWGRVINPQNMSDFMLVEGHPGDVVPTAAPFEGSFDNSQRLFERDTGPPFGWSGGSEAHIKELQTGENTMHIVHRSGNPDVYWDAMVWTNDPDYVPTDNDFLDAASFSSLGLSTVVGDFNGDLAVTAADYDIMLENFNNEVFLGTDGDITFDSYVDYRDFVALRSAIEAGGAAGAASVPEPSSWCLLGLATLLLGSVRQRRRQFGRSGSRCGSRDEHHGW